MTAWQLYKSFLCISLSCFTVDFENTGVCTTTEFVTVRSVDTYNIYAQPPQDNKGIGIVGHLA